MNDELKRHNKTLSKQLDQLKEQIAIKDGILIKVERSKLHFSSYYGTSFKRSKVFYEPI